MEKVLSCKVANYKNIPFFKIGQYMIERCMRDERKEENKEQEI